MQNDNATLRVENRRRSGLVLLPAPEITVVIPCLDEVDTIGRCVAKAIATFAARGIDGEVVVADNGSTDGSVEAALAAGARVVAVEGRGYGRALMGGIAAARSEFVLMGDADDSYDFRELPKFLARLRAGDELVQGCRLPSGGGRVAKGAMPFTHRWIGNPLFSQLARLWFHAPIHDVYCGMRAFRVDLYRSLQLEAPGMEFAIEMIIRASERDARISEVPITLHKDGRRAHRGHLRTVRDGLRTLRLFVEHKFGGARAVG